MVDGRRWGQEREREAPLSYFGASDAAAAKSMNIHAPYTRARAAQSQPSWHESVDGKWNERATAI